MIHNKHQAIQNLREFLFTIDVPLRRSSEKSLRKADPKQMMQIDNPISRVCLSLGLLRLSRSGIDKILN
jgi:hypothetical protein